LFVVCLKQILNHRFLKKNSVNPIVFSLDFRDFSFLYLTTRFMDEKSKSNANKKMIWIFLSVFFLSRASAITYNNEDVPLFELPEISFPKLVARDSETLVSLEKQLTTIGGVQITNIPRFSQARKDALEIAAGCIQENESKKIERSGGHRSTLSTRTVNGLLEPLQGPCGESSSKFRSLIDTTSNQVFTGLDSLLRESSSSGNDLIIEPNYKSFTDLMHKGTHLEYLHTFIPPQEEREASSSLITMDFHTDSGLMIALTAEFLENNEKSDRSGLFLTLPQQINDNNNNKDRTVKVSLSDSSLILLMGEGAQRWLKPAAGRGNSFRAVPHSLIIDSATSEGEQQHKNNRITWYGKSFLPPADAIITGNLPFSSFHFQERETLPNSDFLPLAGELGEFLPNPQCDITKNELLCGQQCLSFLSTSSSSSSCELNDIQCINQETGETMTGNEPCPNCQLECLPPSSDEKTRSLQSSSSSTNNNNNNNYCSGDGASMSMTGFFSLVSDPKGSTPCLNLWFDNWTLNNSTKFAFACLGVLSMGMLVQYLMILRPRLPLWIQNKFTRRIAGGCLFGLTMMLNYVLMLTAMTYSVELFCMVVIGLTGGFALFQSEGRFKKTDLLLGDRKNNYVRLDGMVS
jgi:hypothetical protein